VIAAAKANPGKLTYASYGNGTSAHLAGEIFTNLAKVDITHVPYKGAGPDVLGGQVDMIFGAAAAVAGFVSSGKLRAIGVTSPERSPSPPNIPTIAENVPGYRVGSWCGIYAPAGTPSDIVAKLNATIARGCEHRRIPQEVGSRRRRHQHRQANRSRRFRSRRRGRCARTFIDRSRQP
jgi:tripartite-type tricarboxylate transporter receptor subunit TctC